VGAAESAPGGEGTGRARRSDRPAETAADIVATLLYLVTDRPFRELYTLAAGWSAARRREVMDVALQSRTRRDDLLAGFRGGLYAYDMAIDIGAYRDLHRHRRCSNSGRRTAETWDMTRRNWWKIRSGRGVSASDGGGVASDARAACAGLALSAAVRRRSRFLFKMDLPKRSIFPSCAAG